MGDPPFEYGGPRQDWNIEDIDWDPTEVRAELRTMGSVDPDASASSAAQAVSIRCLKCPSLAGHLHAVCCAAHGACRSLLLAASSARWVPSCDSMSSEKDCRHWLASALRLLSVVGLTEGVHVQVASSSGPTNESGGDVPVVLDTFQSAGSTKRRVPMQCQVPAFHNHSCGTIQLCRLS